MLKRCLLKVLIRPPIIGELYRWQINDREHVLIAFEEQLSDTVIMRNVTAGGEGTFKFRMDNWLAMTLAGVVSHQAWYHTLDF